MMSAVNSGRSSTPAPVTGASKPKSAEMHPGPGFRMLSEIERVDPAITAGFAEFETPEVSDLMNRLYTLNSAVRNMTAPGLRLLGPACTVKAFPGDNLMVHKSLDIVKPGDVVVIDASSSQMTAVLGDLVSMKARHRGIAGFVVDGLIRDLPAILRLGDFPVFARGVTPIGPLHRGPGEINYPVSVGGIVVHPGDLITADLNGVVVVPRESAGELLERLRARAPAERAYSASVAAGQFSNDWVDRALESSGLNP
jgi:regulator of RNase E activity RraA